jgi:hypothetical protein
MIKKALISLVIFFWFISLAVGQYPMVRSSQMRVNLDWELTLAANKADCYFLFG